jgi:hypothetical protein
MLFICVTTLLVFVGLVVIGHFVPAVDGVLKCMFSCARFAAFGYGCGVGVFCRAVAPLFFLLVALGLSVLLPFLCCCFPWIWDDRPVLLGF